MSIRSNKNRNDHDYCKEGNQLRKEGKLVLAIAEYNQALKVNPQCIPALNQLASIYESKKEWSKAIAFYQKILQLAPNRSLVQAKTRENKNDRTR